MESPYSQLYYSSDKTKETISDVLSENKKNAICLLSDSGLIAARIVVLPFSEARIATEMVWWIDPKHRGKREAIELLNAYEYWADNVAIADGCQMSCLSTLNPDKLDRLYRRKGYQLTDTSYLRIFG
jgi:hypothetical protein